MAVHTRSETRKRRRSQVQEYEENDDDDMLEIQSETIWRQTPKRQTSPPEPRMNCNLWHLRFGHPSTTTLQKLKAIKSNFDSTKCRVCIRASQRAFFPFEREDKAKARTDSLWHLWSISRVQRQLYLRANVPWRLYTLVFDGNDQRQDLSNRSKSISWSNQTNRNRNRIKDQISTQTTVGNTKVTSPQY